MFSGIVESQQSIQNVKPLEASVRIEVSRPSDFDDIKTGDSIAVDGICLTLENFSADLMTFALGLETLKVLGLTPASASKLLGQQVNLERSLKWGDRVHGHMVTGHVDARAKVLRAEIVGESMLLDVEIPAAYQTMLWPKGSVTLNGVSLTVNSVDKGILGVCLVPETLKRTNLAALKISDEVNLEVDSLGRALSRALETGMLNVQPI